MMSKKKAEKMLCNDYVNNNGSMGFSGNGSFLPSMNHLGSGFMNKSNEKKMLDELIELELSNNVHRMNISDGFGYGFNGHFLEENGGFSSNPNVHDYLKLKSIENRFPMSPYAMELRSSFNGGERYGMQMQSPSMMMNRHVLDDGFEVEDNRLYHVASPFEEIQGNHGFNTLKDMQDNIYLIAKEQLGCRLLQRVIDEGTYQDMLIVFKGMINHISELMVEPFGNYLIQKLLDVCTEGQRTQVVAMVTKKPGDLIRFSKNTYGTRVVQKIIETVTTRQQIVLLTKALQPGFLDLVKDLNGNHVLQRCLECFTQEQNRFILEGAARFCVNVATERHGCCVLNQCIARSSGRFQENILVQICANALLLAQDAFGNYVVQYVIEQKIPEVIFGLLNVFQGKFVGLSMQKFSSHVVEACLKNYEMSRPIIIHELLSFPQFERLLQDPYANYVIQSALNLTKGRFHVMLARAVKSYNDLRSSPYCKRIFSKKLLNK